MEKLVSVIIPVYNGEKYIAETIESVLAQTYKNIEIVIVDDGSTDLTYAICKDYECKYDQVRVITHDNRENRGVSSSREIGVKCAKGEYIAFCDADDLMMPQKIEKQIPAFNEYKNIVLVHSGVSAFGGQNSFCERFEAGSMIYCNDKGYNLFSQNYRFARNKICMSTIMVKTEVIKKIKFSHKQLFQFEDFVMNILLAQYGTFFFVHEKLTKYRFHEESATFKVITSDLVKYYSNIEFYLVLLKKLRPINVLARIEIILRLVVKLIRLFNCY